MSSFTYNHKSTMKLSYVKSTVSRGRGQHAINNATAFDFVVIFDIIVNSFGFVFQPAFLHDRRHLLVVLTTTFPIEPSGFVVRRTVYIGIMKQRLHNNTKLNCICGSDV